MSVLVLGTDGTRHKRGFARIESSRCGQDRPIAALEGCQHRHYIHVGFDGSSNGLGQIRMPNKDGAAYFPISEDELAVPSRVPVFEAQLVCPFARCFGLPDQKQIYLRHLQLRRGYGARVAQVAAKQVGGGNVGLLHARRPEPVYASLILGDVAGGKM